MTRPERRATARAGRRAGPSGTRDAILEAARSRFSEHGYDAATIRAIASDAGVDPALVHHFYGSKERLFSAAMRFPVAPGEVLAAALAEGPAEPGTSLGEHLVRTAVTLWDSAEVSGAFIGLLRSAFTSEQAAAMLREFISDAILSLLGRAAASADPAEAGYRASLTAAQMLGLALTRYVLKLGPVAAADPAGLARAVGPAIDRYLTGDIS